MAHIISSRTPEGEPAECPVCKALVTVEPFKPLGDVPCPNCGTLLWLCASSDATEYYETSAVAPIRDRILGMISAKLGIPREMIDFSKSAVQLGADSLDIIELIMELEEEFEIEIPDEMAERLKTIGEVVAYFIKRVLDRRMQ